MEASYMKKILLILILSYAYSVGEASAVFLLINPGAGPAGTGEAFVAKADDSYASFYNPAGESSPFFVHIDKNFPNTAVFILSRPEINFVTAHCRFLSISLSAVR